MTKEATQVIPLLGKKVWYSDRPYLLDIETSGINLKTPRNPAILTHLNLLPFPLDL